MTYRQIIHTTGNDEQVGVHTGPWGELIINRDTGRVHVMDTATPGGIPLARYDDWTNPDGSGLSFAWAGITGKPTTFPPSAHTHVTADITGLTALFDAKSNIKRDTRTITGTTDTLVLADAGRLIYTTSASAIAITIPPNSSVPFAIDTQIDFLVRGAGLPTIGQGAGVTIQSIGSNKKIAAQYTGASAVKIATDTWVLFGNLTA